MNEMGTSERTEVEVFEFHLGCIMSNILVRNPKGGVSWTRKSKAKEMSAF